MKYILILALCDGWGIVGESLSVVTVKDKVACERAAKIIERENKYIYAICAPRGN